MCVTFQPLGKQLGYIMWVVLRTLGGLVLAPLVLTGLAIPERTADAAPRQVVIINAAADQQAGFSAASRVRRILSTDPDLDPLPSGDLARGFEAEITGETAEQVALRAAKVLYAEAENLFDVQFENKRARTTLDRAERILLSVAPTEDITARLADVNFLYGLIHLFEQNRGLALDSFLRCRLLDPNRGELNPGAFKPDIVTAFKEAGARVKNKKSANVSISATFDVPIYIDGIDYGMSPVNVDLLPGQHYIVAAAPEYKTASISIDAAANETISQKLELREIARDEQARNLRARAIAGGTIENGALASLAKAATSLANVDAAILITDGAEGPMATVYDGVPDRLSYSRAADDEVGKMLGLLVPVPQPVLPDRPDLFDNSTVTPTPWIRTTPGLITVLGGGAALTTILAIVVSTAFSENDLSNRAGVLKGMQ